MKKDLKLTELCKKEMSRIIGGRDDCHCNCWCSCSCNTQYPYAGQHDGTDSSLQSSNRSGGSITAGNYNSNMPN